MMSKKKGPILLMVDPLSTRVFVKCNIVGRLVSELKSNWGVVYNIPQWQVMHEEITANEIELIDPDQDKVGFNIFEKIWYTIDRLLDSKIGFYPLALRFNLLNSMNLDRLREGHNNYFFDLNYKGPLPNWKLIFNLMKKWTFGRFRFLDPSVKRLLKKRCSILIVSNPQNDLAIEYMLCAKQLNIPIICYIASWDHPVGKGVIFPKASLYLVQNAKMKKDLVKLHHISTDRITITGWPQSDIFHDVSAEAYQKLRLELGIRPNSRVILYAGNTETNNPHEYAFVDRLVRWWQEVGEQAGVTIIFRPHPKDANYLKRFSRVKNTSGLVLQEPSYTDLGELSILLNNVDCVITNAGTIQIDSIANNRPTICVLYDEHRDGTGSYAVKNVQGEHYRLVLESRAFYSARSFTEVEESISLCLTNPSHHDKERSELKKLIYGEVDGLAGARVVGALRGAILRF